MTAKLLLAFVGFSLVTSITPGPNNTMLLASGVNYGFRRTLPHMAGITLGCMVMLVLVGIGLGAVFAASPRLYQVIRIAGAAYLLWLAWQIACAGPTDIGGGRGRPMQFLEAAAFQWVNPKAWIVVTGAVTTYAPREDFVRSVAALTLLLMLTNAPVVALWAGCGMALRGALNKPIRVRAFNIAMAALLVLSLYPILAE